MQEKLEDIIRYFKGKTNPEFLFRVVATGDENRDRAYLLEEYIGQKNIFFPQWKGIVSARDSEYLTREMGRLAIVRNKEIPKPKKGTVVSIYTREDLIADKLKGMHEV